MDWLFERTIELAAWVAFLLCVLFFCDSAWMLVQWLQNLGGGGDNPVSPDGFLAQSGQAAIKFVGAAIALGVLACIDHYVFDLPEERRS